MGREVEGELHALGLCLLPQQKPMCRQVCCSFVHCMCCPCSCTVSMCAFHCPALPLLAAPSSTEAVDAHPAGMLPACALCCPAHPAAHVLWSELQLHFFGGCCGAVTEAPGCTRLQSGKQQE